MGNYYDPGKLVEEGRRLNDGGWESLNAQLQPSEKLYGLYQRPRFKNAVWLKDFDEFIDFESQCDQPERAPSVRGNTINMGGGGLKRLGYFALKV